jgi:hypothetical protein
MHWLRVSSSCPKGKSNSAVHLRRRIEEEGSWGDVIRRRRFGRDEHLTRIAPVADALGLTRIRLQLAIYFCLHGGEFAGKHCKLAGFVFEHEAPAELRMGNPRLVLF